MFHGSEKKAYVKVNIAILRYSRGNDCLRFAHGITDWFRNSGDLFPFARIN